MRDDVQKAKSDLEAAGVDVSGPNAIRITNLVAFRLGYGLLSKEGGSRAVLHPDGSPCRWGDEVREPGFAVDYIIDPRTKFGFDILGDGGGANNPQWPNAPETDFVDRNTRWYHDPINPATYMNVPPPPSPPPLPPPDPGPTVDDEVKSLLKEINANVKANTAELQALRQDVKNAVKTLGQVAESGLLGGLIGGTKKKR